jgi:Putative Ig domain
MQLRIDPWLTRVLALVLVLGALGTMSAPAQIVSAGVGGSITFRSGFPLFNAPFGFVTTGAQNIPVGPGGGLFLQRWHLSPLGYAEGETGIRVLTGPQSYFFNVPANSDLIQRRNVACLPGDPPAELLTHFDAVFRLGPNGLPAHFATLAYPVVGQNAPGPGSSSVFWARLTFGYRDGVGGAITPLGAAVISYSDFRPGAAFSVVPTASRFIPQLQNPFGNRQLLVWGDVLFRTRGCPLLLAAADGLIGAQDGGALPPHDPGILDIPIEDPENLFLDLPLPVFPEDGVGTILQEIVEDASHIANQRPRIQPIPEQRVLEGQTFSYAVVAEDPDGDSLSYGIETTEAGMTIDPNGGVMSWTPGPGSAGVYQATVKATDDRGDLSQTAEEVVTIIVESPN